MEQLPLNFPQTFLPDRRLLSQLLRFATANGRGDKEAIGSETGIPTGKSTGKVEPMIHYARGMGLITAERERGEWQLGATALGAEVLREDAFFSEPLTLWLLHLLLCRRLVVQLQRIAEHVTAWEQGEVPPERLSQVLAQQSADQLAGLLRLLNDQEGDQPADDVKEGLEGEPEEIEPAWDLAAVYQALVQERVAAAERRSEEWIKPRRPLRDVIARADASECERIAHELDGAPGYLARAHQEEIAAMREALAQRRAALEAEARAARVQRWREQFPAADAVAQLDKHRTEQLLQALREPPDPLTAAEQAALEPIGNALHAHYDQMSLDEILARIRRLSQARQRELYGMLAAELG